MSQEYGVDNIQHLETREAIRTRVQMYLGSDDTDGIYQALKEIINNSTDEAIAGYGKEIDIILDEEKSEITVKDYGRGVPFGIKDGRNILVAIYTESHTGGKFDKNAYKNSSGLNGIGGTAVCMSSAYFTVKSERDGICAIAEFEEGLLKSYNESKAKTSTTGTTVIFRPDEKVFINSEKSFEYERICSEIKNISYLNKGIKFVVSTVKGQKTEFYSENGIADFIKDQITTPLMSEPIIASAKDENDEIEIAFIWTSDPTQEYVFVNGLYCPFGGSPITGARRKITTKIKSLSKESFDAELIRRGLVYAINCKVANPSFANQTKSKVNNPSLSTLASEAFDKGLEQFAASSDFATVIKLMKQYQKAEQAADRARDAVLNQNREIEKESRKKSFMSAKLKDCRVHDEKSALYITEGDSALGSFVQSRDSSWVAAMPIRGKIINALKHSIDQILENNEVQDIVKACGCGILDKFNIKNLRYGSIRFAADADPDGASIVCLLLVLFYILMPETIKAGKVYWAQFPLYEVTTTKGKKFAYDDIELNTILKQFPKAQVERNKG